MQQQGIVTKINKMCTNKAFNNITVLKIYEDLKKCMNHLVLFIRLNFCLNVIPQHFQTDEMSTFYCNYSYVLKQFHLQLHYARPGLYI